MNIAALLENLRERGVELRAENGQLRYSAPKGALTSALRSQLTEHKQELLAVLHTLQQNEHFPDGGNRTEFRGQSLALNVRNRRTPLDPVELAGSHTYVQYVNPYLGKWLGRLDLDKEFVRGDGCYLYDSDGTRYLDFIAQYGALPFGYNPREIWASLEKVCAAQLPSFVQPSILTTAGELGKRLAKMAPRGLRYVTFVNSGAEAIEAAIKLCRSATGRLGILSARQSFHGKTLGAMSATGSAFYQDGFGAPVDGFHHIPYGDIEALSNALRVRTGYYAAFLIEPIQGEGGIVEPPEGYLAQARELCRNAGTLFVLDEVQTGLGRTGALFACNHEAVSPDVLTLAKALGGGLMPIGACLCTEEVYNEEFAIRHSSTFAGNALACQAALATLDLLESDNAALISQVAHNGKALKHELLRLQQRYPEVVKSVRGKGYMLGIELNLNAPAVRDGFLGYLADQKLLTYLVASYLLNIERVRAAPTASAEAVLRIEPPLITEWGHCQIFVAALDRALAIIASRDTARLIGHLVGVDHTTAHGSCEPGRLSPRRPSEKGQTFPKPMEDDGRFAFLVHLTNMSDLANLDPSLKVLNEEQLARLRQRGAGLLSPSRLCDTLVKSRTGQKAYGEFIALPYTAQELMEMPPDEALSEIGRGVEFAKQRGAQIVGLGGFTSVATLGGLALKDLDLGPLTTGNSYTVAAAIRGLRSVCSHRKRQLSMSCVAVLGATGAIGRAIALLLAEDAAHLVLTGNPRHVGRSRSRLLEVAASILEHLWELHTRHQHEFAPNTLGASFVSLSRNLPAKPSTADFSVLADEMERRSGRLSVSTDLTGCLPQADIVVTATSAVGGIIQANHLKSDAIVCEISRPFNTTTEVRASRPDVLFLDGGLVQPPSKPDLGWDIGCRPGTIFACMAETILLALERRYADASLGPDLDLELIRELDALGDKHGFSVECDCDEANSGTSFPSAVSASQHMTPNDVVSLGFANRTSEDPYFD